MKRMSTRAPLPSRSLGGLCAAAMILGAVPAAAAEVAFVEASSELDANAQLWNAVDGKESTAWCSRADDMSPLLSIGFDEPVTITHLGLVVGALKGDALAKENRRARLVFAEDAGHRVEVKFRDVAQLQVLELTPAIKGRRVTLEFAGSFDGAASESPLCIGDVVLKSKETTLTGPATANRLRAVSSAGRKLLHEWLDDPSAPQRTLLFSVDGTFSYTYTPLLEGKPAKVRGKWSAADRFVTLEVGGKSYKLASRLTRIDDGTAHTMELVLEGDGPTPSMAATYRPAPARVR